MQRLKDCVKHATCDWSRHVLSQFLVLVEQLVRFSKIQRLERQRI